MILMNIIKSSPLFTELYDDEISILIKDCSVRVLEPQEFIFKEGEMGKDIYVVLTGKVVVCKEEMVLSTLEKGDLFGELVLVNEPLRTADCVAKTYSEILIINRDIIFGLFGKNPRLFSILMMNVARRLALRLQRTNTEISELYHFMNKAS